MGKNTLKRIAFVGLTLGLLETPAAHGDDCASIGWKMNEYAYVPILEYVDCHTKKWKETSAHYTYMNNIHDALVGSAIDLGPSGTSSNYTDGQVVQPGENNFLCTGWYGSSGRCLRLGSGGCGGSIMWGMQDYPEKLPPWIPRLEYINCNGEMVTTPARWSGVVHDALIGSEINLGPMSTNADYTKGELVKKGESNKFECTGGVGSTGRCSRIQ